MNFTAKKFFKLILWPTTALSLAACAEKSGVVSTNSYAIVTAKANLFENGPAQASGRDLELSAGETVAVLDRAFGYSRVRTAEDVTGYVASRFLRPTAAPQLASHIDNQGLLPSVAPMAPTTGTFNENDFGQVFPDTGASEPLPKP